MSEDDKLKEFYVTMKRIKEIETKALKKLRDKKDDSDPDDNEPDAA